MVIDSHVHLLDPRLRDRAEKIVSNLKKDGIECVIEISADVLESREAVTFAQKHENVYCTIGVHPIFADSFCTEFETWAVAQKGNKKIVAIGECGLDYYHLETPTKLQKDVFVAQIKLAYKMRLPLVVHSRDAFDDTFEILDKHRKYLKHGLVLHCFSGGVDEVERFKTLDCYFAFGGAITYNLPRQLVQPAATPSQAKGNYLAAEAIRAVPRDRLIIETDCPYLSPVPLRGTVNEPKNVKIVAEYIAGVLGVSFDEVAKLTTENVKRLFRIS